MVEMLQQEQQPPALVGSCPNPRRCIVVNKSRLRVFAGLGFALNAFFTVKLFLWLDNGAAVYVAAPAKTNLALLSSSSSSDRILLESVKQEVKNATLLVPDKNMTLPPQQQVPAALEDPQPLQEEDKSYLPTYEEYKSKLAALEREIGTHMPVSTVRACGHNYTNGDCRLQQDEHLILYNPSSLERIMCNGRFTIAPHTAKVVTLQNLCTPLRSSLLETVPSVSTLDKLPSIDITNGGGKPTGNHKIKCNVPCTAPGGHGSIKQTKTIAGTPWSFVASMEGPHYYQDLKFDPKAHLRNKFFATTSFQSEIPLPYFSWHDYGTRIQAPQVQYSNAIPGAVFIARNCHSKNKREDVVKELIQSKLRVDSVSSCLNNAPKPHGNNDKKTIMKQYLFYLAFENQNEDDYITEKLWEALESGVLPVYMGAPNIAQHVPANSIIDVHSFPSTQDLIVFLNKVATNQTLYDSFHAWRTQPLPQWFQDKYDFTNTHSTCRLCRWAMAKKYGLGWNPTTQQVQEPKIVRRICLAQDGVLLSGEQWKTTTSGGAAKIANKKTSAKVSGCTKQSFWSAGHLKLVEDGATTLRRTLWYHDGVVDLELQPTHQGLPLKGPLVLEMDSRLKGAAATLANDTTTNTNTFRFQDAHSRMTILASRSVTATLTSNNRKVEISISHASHVPLRLRFIVEDINTFYGPSGISETSYFEEQMTLDFEHPVELMAVRSKGHLSKEYLMEDKRRQRQPPTADHRPTNHVVKPTKKKNTSTTRQKKTKPPRPTTRQQDMGRTPKQESVTRTRTSAILQRQHKTTTSQAHLQEHKVDYGTRHHTTTTRTARESAARKTSTTNAITTTRGKRTESHTGKHTISTTRRTGTNRQEAERRVKKTNAVPVSSNVRPHHHYEPLRKKTNDATDHHYRFHQADRPKPMQLAVHNHPSALHSNRIKRFG